MDGAELFGRVLRVNIARPAQLGSGASGGGSGSSFKDARDWLDEGERRRGGARAGEGRDREEEGRRRRRGEEDGEEELARGERGGE
jgi:hypothetical protein